MSVLLTPNLQTSENDFIANRKLTDCYSIIFGKEYGKI
jgi:hypothetical protein